MNRCASAAARMPVAEVVVGDGQKRCPLTKACTCGRVQVRAVICVPCGPLQVQEVVGHKVVEANGPFLAQVLAGHEELPGEPGALGCLSWGDALGSEKIAALLVVPEESSLEHLNTTR